MTARILVADDHERVRAALSETIRSIDRSWEVHEAADGQAAVEKAAAVAPDLVILDLRMPRIDGLKAGRMIRKILPNAAMLLYTFTPLGFVQTEAQKAGFQEVVEKPDIQALIVTIQEVLSPSAACDRNSRHAKTAGRAYDPPSASSGVVERK